MLQLCLLHFSWWVMYCWSKLNRQWKVFRLVLGYKRASKDMLLTIYQYFLLAMTCTSAHAHAILFKIIALLWLMTLDKLKIQTKREDGLDTTLYFPFKPHPLNESFERRCARNPLGKHGWDLQTTLDFPNAPLPPCTALLASSSYLAPHQWC